MKLSSCLLASLTHVVVVDGFSLRMTANLPPPLRLIAASPPPKSALSLAAATAAPIIESRPPRATPSKPRTLGLITFDLDDSLYPIEPVLSDANNVFVKTMAEYGYSIEPQDIVDAGKRIREEAGPVAGTTMSHTEVRMGAIRLEMEK